MKTSVSRPLIFSSSMDILLLILSVTADIFRKQIPLHQNKFLHVVHLSQIYGELVYNMPLIFTGVECLVKGTLNEMNHESKLAHAVCQSAGCP